jgi:putative tricarboxylic transport membrane protein
MRPWVLVFIAVLLVPALMAAIRSIRARRNIDIDDAHHEPPGEDEGELTGSIWSLVTAAGSLVLFLAGFIVASSFSPDARLVPRLLCGGGVVVAGWLLATEVRDRLRAGAGVRWTPDVGVALRTFGWMGAFLLLVALGGYLAAMLIWVPAFLLFVSRARPRTVIAYTLAASVLVAVLPSLLPVDLPAGLLMSA